jgi:hypothetical protein
LSLAGRLEEVELAELLHFLALNSRTGKISLTRRGGNGLVVLRLGRVVYAASRSRESPSRTISPATYASRSSSPPLWRRRLNAARRGRASEAVVVPMILRDGVGLVFYGDDVPVGRALGPVEELEWALLEAGLGMERDLLEDRLRAFERARGHRP